MNVKKKNTLQRTKITMVPVTPESKTISNKIFTQEFQGLIFYFKYAKHFASCSYC